MYLRDVLMSCLRRWPLLLVFLLASGGLWYFAFTQIPPSYEAKASVVLVPPVNTELPNQNRYLGLGGLKQSADVLTRSMSSEEIAKEIKKEAPGGTYTIEPDFATSAPILVVTTKSRYPDAADRVLESVLLRIPDNLRALQEAVDIKPANQITEILVAHTDKPDVVQKTRIRILGLLGVVLLVGSGLTVGAIDGLLIRRRTSRAAKRREGLVPPRATPEPPYGDDGHPPPPAMRVNREPVARPSRQR